MSIAYNDIGLDHQDNLVTAFTVGSGTFKVPEGGYDTTFNGGVTDIVVAKYEAGTGKLLGATYIGGSGGDWCRDLAVDDNGYILVTGQTGSEDFPATLNSGFRPTESQKQAFVIKLDKDLKHLESSILLGPGEGLAIASGRNEETLVAGRSTATVLPIKMNVYDSSFNGAESDVFVAGITGPSEFKQLEATGMAAQYQIPYDLLVRRFAFDSWQEYGLYGPVDNNSGSPLKDRALS